MIEAAVLNNIDHAELRVRTHASHQFGDNVGGVHVFANEFADVQRDYPILFQQDEESGQFHAVALLGFKQNENLFLEGEQWKAQYVPAIMTKGPFLIGFQDQSSSGGSEKEPVILIDTSNPRVNTTSGESIFLENGGNTPYLDAICENLKMMHQGTELNQKMFVAFQKHKLIEPVSIEAEFIDEDKIIFESYYTINAGALNNLSGDALEELNQAGFLQSAFLCSASLKNIQKLVDMKNQKLVSAAND